MEGTHRTGMRLILLVVLAAALITPPASAARNCFAATWRTDRDGDQNCPRSHSYLSDWNWTQLSWTVWGKLRAGGRGVAVHRSGAQVDERDEIRIRLSQPKDCSDGTRIYTRIDVAWYYPTGLQHYSWRYYCQPGLTPGGGG
jgi:hypothetical protein